MGNNQFNLCRDIYELLELIRAPFLERKEDVYKKLLSDNEARGLQKGKVEGKIEVAKTMKNAGMTKEVIKQITELGTEEVDRIFREESVKIIKKNTVLRDD